MFLPLIKAHRTQFALEGRLIIVPIAFFILMPLTLLMLVSAIYTAQWIIKNPLVSKAMKVTVVSLTVLVTLAIIVTLLVKLPQMWPQG